jgi:hypothetical protein
VTDYDNARELRNEAVRCRRLAASVADALTVERLGILAGEYEQRAEVIRLGIQNDCVIKPIS